MVRRGSKLSGSVSSAKSVKSGGRWSRPRPNSANDGDLKSNMGGVANSKNSQSAKSSPTSMAQNMSRAPSPTISTSSSSKKSSIAPLSTSSSNNSKTSRGGASSYWRSRGNLRSIDMSDPRFSITNEDFPALPGVDGKGKMTSANSSAHHELKNESSDLLSSNDSTSIQHFANSTHEQTSADDSGVSSVSRGNTPEECVQEVVVAKKNEKKKGSPNETSPRKQYNNNSTPRKKSNNNTNSNNTSPLSFLKLSKSGQKVPERRGRLNSRMNGPSPPQKPSLISVSTGDEEEENAMIEKQEEEFVMPLEHTEEIKELPKIQLGRDGEMTNIPSTMLNDQFGLAAMLPLLTLMKNRNSPKLHDDVPKSPEKEQEEMITMVSYGLDLNSLGVPTKHDQKQVWSTFAGPFGTDQLAPISMGVAFYELPSVYYTARTLQGTIDMNKTMPGKLGVHELFYIFYNFPQEFWQLNTSRELQNRGWRYCIPEKLWVHRKVNTDEFGVNSLGHTISAIFNLPGDEIVPGIFEVYDPEKMRIITREMRLKSSEMEAASWEHGKEDKMYKALLTILPPEHIWGPQRNVDDKVRSGMPASVKTAFNRAPAPPSKSQTANRRILSFVEPDNQEQTSSSSRNEDYQRQMYAAFMQQFSNRYQSGGSTNTAPAASTRQPANSLYRQSQSTSYLHHQHHHNHLHH